MNGAPERIRTPNPQIRSLVLYPVELRAPAGGLRGRPNEGAKLLATPSDGKVRLARSGRTNAACRSKGHCVISLWEIREVRVSLASTAPWGRCISMPAP